MGINDEDEMTQVKQGQVTDTETADITWKNLYIVGGTTALITIGVGVIEILITFLPGGNVSYETVIDWFTLFQHNWFLGLRNLGFLNIFLTLLGIPTFLALYGAHRQVNQAFAMLAMIISFIGVAVFLATNRAFAMFELSHQYAAATTAAQQATIVAAGQTMLSIGKSHTLGSFLGFFLSEVAGIIISGVMLQGKIFSKVAAYAGVAGFSILLIFDIISAFVPRLDNMAMIFAMIGGLLTMVWHILLARRFFQLGREG